ncbi:MAG: prepilin-type N-terminal cleavage/methylation domain-containing protein [Bacteroidales bacterium]|nr:prepilin-type N-terminal cleavage/methylation domain-containing protein [Bacteroidales bacterium]
MIKTQKGMTLIELMITLAILSVIILGLVVFFTSGVRSWITGQYQLEAQRNARQAMESMVREIRHGESIVVNSDDDTIIVSVPALGTEFAYNVTYDLSGTTISRGINPLISNVQSLILEYYESDGTPIASPVPVNNEVSKIHIELQVDVDKDNNPDITLNSDIDLRNYDL